MLEALKSVDNDYRIATYFRRHRPSTRGQQVWPARLCLRTDPGVVGHDAGLMWDPLRLLSAQELAPNRRAPPSDEMSIPIRK
jgi:hypothetical protein